MMKYPNQTTNLKEIRREKNTLNSTTELQSEKPRLCESLQDKESNFVIKYISRQQGEEGDAEETYRLRHVEDRPHNLLGCVARVWILILHAG